MTRVGGAVAGREQRKHEIRQFIIDHVRQHPQNIAALVAEQFGVSRQAAVRHLQRLQAEGVIKVQGETRSRRYELVPLKVASFSYQIQPEMAEDKVWREDVAPLLAGIRDNVYQICNYGFTEIFNNALEHSEGRSVHVSIELWPDQVVMHIMDDGVGIFNKIQRDLGLDDPLHAILELSKGKLTTDPHHHSGEGIFFTSRAFDTFRIASHSLLFMHGADDVDVLLEHEAPVDGTGVTMQIDLCSERTMKAVLERYSVDEYQFDRTIVPVFLAQYGQDNLVSRSQAKRLLARFDRFKQVILDFAKVDFIGQAFADEIFRVYARDHPQVALRWMNANEEVAGMIARVQRARQEASDPTGGSGT